MRLHKHYKRVLRRIGYKHIERKSQPMQYKDLRNNPEVWNILEERAQALARQKVDTDIGLGEEVIVFRLGEGRYSIPAHFIREVQPMTSYTPLPSTPSFVIGLVNVRGRLLTAIDIRPLMDIVQTSLGNLSFLLILSANSMEVCLIADAVVEVCYSDANLAQALSTTTGRGVTWIRGVDKNLNVLVDPPLLLSDPRIIVNSETE